MHYRDKKNRKYIITRRATGIYYTLSHRTDPLCISVNKTETVHNSTLNIWVCFEMFNLYEIVRFYY